MWAELCLRSCLDGLRILIVDDHGATRNGVRRLLASHPNWDICGEAADGFDAIEKTRLLRPQLILMDVSMPHLNGIDASRIIRSEMPDCAIVLVSQNDPAVVLAQANAIGARGFVPKDELASRLLPTLRRWPLRSPRSGAPPG